MMSKSHWILVSLVVVFAPVISQGQVRQVRSIRIGSYACEKPGEIINLTISNISGQFVSNGNAISEHMVTRLLTAINMPIHRRAELRNLGVTQAWLNENADAAVKEYARGYYNSANPKQKALYLLTFTNLRIAARLVNEILNGRWTDDYPLVEIEIELLNGSKIKVSSEQQPEFMLPWKITRSGRTILSYNADIARALAALLPENGCNRSRLSGVDLRQDLAEKVIDQIEPQWNLLEAEEKAGPFLDLLRSKFIISAAHINPYHDVDFGTPQESGRAPDPNLNVTLTAKNFPSNFSITLVLPYRDETVEGTDEFISSIDRYLNLMKAIPWLRTYIANHPNLLFDLHYVTDRSFSSKAMSAFDADLRLSGRADLVEAVSRVQDKVALFTIVGGNSVSYWVILPDRRTILWRFDGQGALLRWRNVDLLAWDCGSHSKCSGLVVDAQGKRDTRVLNWHP